MKKLFMLLILCGAAFSCSTKYMLSKQIKYSNPQIEYDDTISPNNRDRAIAEIIEDKFLEFKEYEPLWGVATIMDSKSGYTRTISCDATDNKIGESTIDFASELIYPGSIVLPLYYMQLIDKGGVLPLETINLDVNQDTIEGVVIEDPCKIEAKTIREAFIKGSRVAIARECYDKLKFNNIDLKQFGNYGDISHRDLIMMCNTVASGGYIVKCKYDRDEPTKINERHLFSKQAAQECKECMIQHAKDNKLGDMAVYSSMTKHPEVDEPNYSTIFIGFVLSDNPKCSVVVSFNTRKPLSPKGIQILPLIINELNKEE